MNLATSITILRVILILPILILLSYQELIYSILSLVLLTIAGITDFLDGYIARRTNTESSLGALLDLLADKLLVTLILVWIMYLDPSIYLAIPVLIIVSREIIISSIRQFIVQNKNFVPPEVSFLAKSKTTTQILAICFIIISPEISPYLYKISLGFLWLVSLFSLYSLYDYLKEWNFLYHSD